jgi:peptide chain release factor 3
MKQLASEGTMQVLYPLGKVNPEPIVAAVGVLQFEVLQYRLKDEYGVDTRLESLPQQSSAWLVGDPKTFQKTTSSVVAEDPQGRVIVLFSNTWERNYSLEKNPNHRFEDFSST